MCSVLQFIAWLEGSIDIINSIPLLASFIERVCWEEDKLGCLAELCRIIVVCVCAHMHAVLCVYECVTLNK